MNTRFLFQGLTVDNRTEDYIRKRLQRIEKLVDPVSHSEVEIHRNKQGKFLVVIMVHTPHFLYRAEEISESVEGSTDIVIDELELQITKKKDRLRALRLRGQRSIKKKLVLNFAARF